MVKHHRKQVAHTLNKIQDIFTWMKWNESYSVWICHSTAGTKKLWLDWFHNFVCPEICWFIEMHSYAIAREWYSFYCRRAVQRSKTQTYMTCDKITYAIVCRNAHLTSEKFLIILMPVISIIGKLSFDNSENIYNVQHQLYLVRTISELFKCQQPIFGLSDCICIATISLQLFKL